MSLNAEVVFRNRAAMYERITFDVGGLDRDLVNIEARLGELRRVDRQLASVAEKASELPADLVSRHTFAESGSRYTETIPDARLVVLAALEGARRVVADNRGKAEAERDRKRPQLDHLRKVLATEYAEFA